MKRDELFRFENPDQARSLQQELSGQVIHIEDSGFKPRLFCGIDVSYDDNVAKVAGAVWDSEQHEFVERVQSRESVSVQYLPEMFGFREGPITVGLYEKLTCKPEVFLIDGHGAAHPRRLGLACHFGLAVERPTVGVAKSRLYGRIDRECILDPEGDTVGRIITTDSGRRFYVSVGHRISLDAAVRVVETSIVGGHPAPLRQAHLDSINTKEKHSN